MPYLSVTNEEARALARILGDAADPISIAYVYPPEDKRILEQLYNRLFSEQQKSKK